MRTRDHLVKIRTRWAAAFVATTLGVAASVSLAHASVASPERASAMARPARVMDRGAACQPQWAADLFCVPGVDYPFSAAVTWDDGTGEALYVGGFLRAAGCVSANGVARWDGSEWSALGSGVEGADAAVFALAVFDDGSGPALYAAGSFSTAGGQPASNIARWDGSAWSPLGSGTNSTVSALTVFDDGSGPALYAGGWFVDAGGQTVNQIARWNGSEWSPLGSGLGGADPAVLALTVFDDGTGPALFAAGWFTTAGGQAVSHIARWNGSEWSPLGPGLDGGVYALAVMDDGAGPALYAGGWFDEAGGQPASRIARWDGSAWSALGSGLTGGDFPEVVALQVFDDGQGPALYASGRFLTAGGLWSPHLARWDGTAWSSQDFVLFTDEPDGVWGLTVFDDGTGAGPQLHASGWFTSNSGSAANGIARWNGWTWLPLGSQPAGPNREVFALTVFDDGGGAGLALYAGGAFNSAGGQAAQRIARWDGTSWSSLGFGVSQPGTITSDAVVKALAVFDDGSGTALFVAGRFGLAGGATARQIARWNGSDWSALGLGIRNVAGSDPDVNALAVFDDGSGPALYAGGQFRFAGDQTVSNVARWNGSSWSPLGSGVNGSIHALTVFDDGGGPALYAGGEFTTAGGQPAHRIARWDGQAWSAVGSGVADSISVRVNALSVFDDGGGPALYAGGRFTTAGGQSANHIARWDGSAWSPVGPGLSHEVHALTVSDDGDGPALYAGGWFTTAGGQAVSHIARWNGSAWSSVGTGVNSAVHALAAYDDGEGPALYAGGLFTTAGGNASAYLAKWQRCPTLPVCAPDLTGDALLNFFDIATFLDLYQTQDPIADWNADGLFNFFDLASYLNAFNAGCP